MKESNKKIGKNTRLPFLDKFNGKANKISKQGIIQLFKNIQPLGIQDYQRNAIKQPQPARSTRRIISEASVSQAFKAQTNKRALPPIASKTDLEVRYNRKLIKVKSEMEEPRYPKSHTIDHKTNNRFQSDPILPQRSIFNKKSEMISDRIVSQLRPKKNTFVDYKQMKKQPKYFESSYNMQVQLVGDQNFQAQAQKHFAFLENLQKRIKTQHHIV